jgi:RNA polymerase sigma factor (sigma-70 family)
MSDWELLQEYVRSRSGAAFAQLVERHVRWVHSVCTRSTRDAHLAEDVTQAVFLLLSQKASRLRAGTSVSGWLFRTAQHTSSNAMTSQRRRAKREAVYAAERPTEATPSAAGGESEFTSAIDQGLARLRQPDRDLLVLRFYSNKTVSEAALELGISDDAARKRFTRAIDALKQAVAAQGVSVPAVGAAAAMMGAMQSAPPVAMSGALASWLAGGASPSAVSSAAVAIAKAVSFKAVAVWMIAASSVAAAAIAVAVIATMTTKPATLPAATSIPPPPRTRLVQPIVSRPALQPALILSASAASQPNGFRSQTLVGHTSTIASAAVSPNGRFAASRSLNELLRWDLTTAAPTILAVPMAAQPFALAVSNGGLVAAIDGRDIVIFDSAFAKEPRHLAPANGARSPHWSIALSPDAKTLALGGIDGQIRLLNVADGSQIRSYPAHARLIYTLAFSHDGRTILSGGTDDHDVVLSDVTTGKEIQHLKGHTSMICGVQFSPDGKSALSFGRSMIEPKARTVDDGFLRVWDLATGKELHRLAPSAGVISAATFSPDGTRVAAYCLVANKGPVTQNQLVVWDLATGKQTATFELDGPRGLGFTLAICFTPDARQLLVGGDLARGTSLDLIDLNGVLAHLPADK